MNVFETNNRQLSILLYSLCISFVVGVIYTLFQVLFTVCVGKRKNIIFRISLDLLFSLVYTLIAVVFVYAANSGKIRAYILVFSLLGFTLYQLTAGKLLYRLLVLIIDKTIRLLKTAISLLLMPFYVLVRAMARYFKKKQRKRKLTKLIREGII